MIRLQPTDSELLRIYDKALSSCCGFCHLIAKEYEYDIIVNHKMKNGGRIITDRLKKCTSCDYYLLKYKSFIVNCKV